MRAGTCSLTIVAPDLACDLTCARRSLASRLGSVRAPGARPEERELFVVHVHLLTSYSEIVEALNAGESCDVVYLDFAKAFDKVSYKQLLFKLWRLGITG